MWRRHPDFPNYLISNCGEVINERKNKHISVSVGNRGEQRVVLFRNGVGKYFQLSRLVAELYLPDYDPLNFVRFKDGDRTNCHVDNLDNTTFGAH